MCEFLVRPYRQQDRAGVRAIYGLDEFARPHLQARYPRMGTFLADSMAHYYDLEPASCFVALAGEQVVGALLGALDSGRCEANYRRYTRPLLVRRLLRGVYGWPGWLWATWRTEWANRKTEFLQPDLRRYPAHLHIGVPPGWRRRGIGTALMERFVDYLRQNNAAGFHLFASSFHPLGVAFYRKLNLQVLGQFDWWFHDGQELKRVTETLFGQVLEERL